MLGATFKEIVMRETGLGFNDIAKKLNIPTQTMVGVFKSPNVNSSYLELAVEQLGVNPLTFFPNYEPNAIIEDEPLTIQDHYKILHKSQQQFDKSQEQLDRLIAAIEELKKV